MTQSTCPVEGCGKPAVKREWCNTHYEQRRRSGELPDVRVVLEWPENLLQRMEPQPNGCVHYTGSILTQGYGQISVHGKMMRAHRSAYEHFVGPIPDGMTIDHECHNRDETCAGGPTCLHRRCVNPDHLAPKPSGENILASRNTRASRNAAKTHCVHGHEFTEENTRIRPSGGRSCRTCDLVNGRRHDAARRVSQSRRGLR